MKTYEEYQDSGIEWIGDIPSGWELVPVKSIFHIGRGRVISQQELVEDGEYPVYSSQTKYNGCLGYISTYDFNCTQITWTTDGANAGTVFLRNGKHNCTNVCGTLQLKNQGQLLNYHFYFLQYVTLYYKRPDTNGAKIMNGEMGKIVLAIPPLHTQISIANYLDEKIMKIDNIIADKQNFITLLKEKRQNIIGESITKGLDKNVPMKDSDVEWIGKVPQHWEVKRLKRIFEIVKRLYYQLDRSVLSITQRGLKIKDLESNDGQHAETYAGYQVVNVNDFAMNSMDLLTGYVDCSVFEGVTSPDYRVFRFWKNKIQSHSYYKHLFQMCYKNRIFYGYGQGVSNLGRWRLQTEVFLNFLIPQPPLQEQIDIAKYIDYKTTLIDSIISEITIQIEKLKEYRQSVISEAVTGKIKIEDITQGGVS